MDFLAFQCISCFEKSSMQKIVLTIANKQSINQHHKMDFDHTKNFSINFCLSLKSLLCHQGVITSYKNRREIKISAHVVKRQRTGQQRRMIEMEPFRSYLPCWTSLVYFWYNEPYKISIRHLPLNVTFTSKEIWNQAWYICEDNFFKKLS